MSRAVSAEAARKFFEHDVVLKAAADVHRLFGADGSIAFKVGAAAWTFRFASIAPVEPGFDRTAKLRMWFTEEAFCELVEGTLDVPQAVTAGAVKAKGDVRLLQMFGRFLQPEVANLGWDAGT